MPKPSKKTDDGRNWFKAIVRDWSEMMPNDDRKTYLPACYNKRELYQTYIQSRPEEERSNLLSYDTFKRMWKRDFPGVKIRPVSVDEIIVTCKVPSILITRFCLTRIQQDMSSPC